MKGRAAQTSGLVSQISFFFFFIGRGWSEVVIQQLLRCMVVSPKEFVPSYVFFVLFFFRGGDVTYVGAPALSRV